MFLNALGMAAGIVSIAAIFFHTRTLAGWTGPEAIVLLGTYSITNGLLQTFVEPNLTFFATKVTNGELDDVLLKPIPSLFSATLGNCNPFGISGSILGLVLVVLGARTTAGEITATRLGGFVLLFVSGVAVMWASRTLLATLALWAPGFDATLIYFPLWQLGRYPIGVYPRTVRWLLTYALPVVLVAVAPARALMRDVSVTTLVGGVTAAVVAICITRFIWALGLRRYTSATS